MVGTGGVVLFAELGVGGLRRFELDDGLKILLYGGIQLLEAGEAVLCKVGVEQPALGTRSERLRIELGEAGATDLLLVGATAEFEKELYGMCPQHILEDVTPNAGIFKVG